MGGRVSQIGMPQPPSKNADGWDIQYFFDADGVFYDEYNYTDGVNETPRELLPDDSDDDCDDDDYYHNYDSGDPEDYEDDDEKEKKKKKKISNEFSSVTDPSILSVLLEKYSQSHSELVSGHLRSMLYWGEDVIFRLMRRSYLSEIQFPTGFLERFGNEILMVAKNRRMIDVLHICLEDKTIIPSAEIMVEFGKWEILLFGTYDATRLVRSLFMKFDFDNTEKVQLNRIFDSWNASWTYRSCYPIQTLVDSYESEDRMMRRGFTPEETHIKRFMIIQFKWIERLQDLFLSGWYWPKHWYEKKKTMPIVEDAAMQYVVALSYIPWNSVRPLFFMYGEGFISLIRTLLLVNAMIGTVQELPYMPREIWNTITSFVRREDFIIRPIKTIRFEYQAEYLNSLYIKYRKSEMLKK